MKRGEYSSIGVRCPFYRRENAQEIKCGSFTDGTSTHLAFAEKAQKRAYKAVVCGKDYEQCPLHNIFAKAAEKEEEA